MTKTSTDVSDVDWTANDRAHLWRPYCQMARAAPALPVVATRGSRLTLADGRELIDGIASWWTACHGYNDPHIATAVRRQLERMPHVMFGGLTHEPAATLAARLAALLPGDLDHVFFCDSGSVAVEVAMKMAIQFFLNRGERGRSKILAFRGGYHGDTLGTMAVCDPEEGMHAHFADALPQQIIADLPRDAATSAAFDACLERDGTRIAAILVEPLVQGAGGMIFHDAAVLARLRAAAARHGCLLIFDEIFTGFGRTGAMFASDKAQVAPDIVTLGKALTGGTMTLAATVASKRVFDGFLSDDPMHALMHGPTYMANPLACAAANASLDLFEREPRLAQAAAIEASLRDGLAPLAGRAGVRNVRVAGAIGVVELERIDDLDGLKARFVDAGVWVRPFRNIVYLTPALTIAPADLDRLISAIVEIVGR